MIILVNPRNLATVLLAGAWLAAAVGCGREAGPTARKQPGVGGGAAASATAPPGAVQSESQKKARRGGEEDLRAEQAQPAGVLTHVTGAQLLAAMRESRRKGTLVNAWASWCGPCRRELPMLQALSTNLKPQGVEVVLVSVDEPKDEAKAQAFLKDNAIALKSYFVEGSIADFKEAINPRWPGMLPASFLFDRTAALVHFWGGEAFETEIVPVVESFLAGRAVEPETRYGLAPGKVDP